MRLRQFGFTLVELVLVILIVGVLAATALPRFMDTGAKAQQAVAKQVLGSFNTAVVASRLQWQAIGQPKFITTSNGTTLYFNAQGWPVSTGGNPKDANGWALIGGGNSNCVDVLQSLISGVTVLNKTDVDTGLSDALNFDFCARASNLNGQPVNTEQCNFVQTHPYGACFPSYPSSWINYDATVGTITAVNF